MASKILQILRNTSVVADFSTAKSTLEAQKTSCLDGEVLAARYYDEDGETVKSLFGVVYNDGTSQTVTYFEGVNADSESTLPSEIQQAIDNIENQITVIIQGAGLNEDGTYEPDSDSTIIGDATSLNDAIDKLADALAQEIEDRESAITEAIEGLVYEDTAEAGSFVTSVSEKDGVISVTRAKIASDNQTVTVTSDADGNVDLKVNIDGETITADENGVLSVASTALTQYVGKEAIAVSEPDADNNKTISLTIEESEKVLSQSEDGLKTTLGVNYDSDTKMVQLTGIDDEVISEFDATEFIYDGIIKDVELVQEDPETGKTGEFIKITFYTKPDESGEMETQDIYLDVTDLTDVYVAGDGITIEQGDDGYVVSVKVSDDSESFLTVTEDGVTLSGVQDAIDEAVSDAKSELEEEIKEAAASATTSVALADGEEHLTLESSTDSSTGATTYTIGSTDVASAETVSNMITAAGCLNEDGSYNSDWQGDITKDATSLAEALEALEKEVIADETSMSVTNSDGSITVDTTGDTTDVSVHFAEAVDGENANDMISVSADGIVLSNVWDCGEY